MKHRLKALILVGMLFIIGTVLWRTNHDVWRQAFTIESFSLVVNVMAFIGLLLYFLSGRRFGSYLLILFGVSAVISIALLIIHHSSTVDIVMFGFSKVVGGGLIYFCAMANNEGDKDRRSE